MKTLTFLNSFRFFSYPTEIKYLIEKFTITRILKRQILRQLSTNTTIQSTGLVEIQRQKTSKVVYFLKTRLDSKKRLTVFR